MSNAKAFSTMSLLVMAVSAGPSRHAVRVEAAGQPVTQAAEQPQAPSRALFDRYCVTCHNERLKTGGLMLDKVDLTRVEAHREALEKVARKLRSGQMPPPDRPRPDDAAVKAFVASLEHVLDRASVAAPDPGRVVSHRLNRTEYVNVIRDLLALEINGSALLPSDMAGFGFDNNADVLSMTPALMDRYITAATKVSRLAVGTRENRTAIQSYRVPTSARQNSRMGEDLPFATRGGLAARHAFSLDGEYVFKLRMSRNDGGDTILGNVAEREYQIELRIDHTPVARLSVGGKYKGQVKYDMAGGISAPEDDVVHQQLALYHQTADKHLQVRLPVKAGTRLVSAAFTEVAPSPFEGTGDNSPAGLLSLDIDGPYGGTVPTETESRRRIFVCRPDGLQSEKPCALKILGTLARRAYRRPITDADLQPLLNVYESTRTGRDFDTGIERALEMLLSMPEFLMRAESDPPNPTTGTIYRISDLELASRLSFFLWKSIPDDELLDLGARGRLHDPAVLAQQTRRMLADRRATRWMNDFLGQWLQIRNLETIEPDPIRFPDFDSTLREAMLEESELFFESQVRDDRPLLDLLRADYTFLNARLAEHYGVWNVYGSHFRRVPVTDPARPGLLGHASVLTTTSYADRTSVVLRGKWVLETLLGAPPPPPPPNVPPLKQNDGKSKPASLRERMEQHRSNAVCASCHATMDPLGFALENFNAIGKWREDDDGAPINTAITLRGASVDSPKAFREALLRLSDEFTRTVTEKLLTYALGRGLDYRDAATVRHLVREGSPDNYRWSSLILGIVASPPFQQRIVRDGAPEQPPPSTVARNR
jgi:mono/diheme cytochrome c family protein